MRFERSMSPRPLVAAGFGALLLAAGTLVGAAPAAAQEPARAQIEQRREEALARQERALQKARAELEERATANKAALEAALQEARAPRPGVRFAGPGMAMFGSRGPSAEAILASAEELELDDAQIDQIRGVHRDHRRAEIGRDADIEVAELDLEDLMQDPDEMDLQAVEAKMMEIAGLRVQSRMADLRLQREIDGVLTAEQRDKLEDMHGGLLFRARGDAPGGYFFRGDGDGWRELMRDGGHQRMWLDRELEPLRELQWFRFDRRSDDDDEHEAEESEDGGVVGS